MTPAEVVDAQLAAYNARDLAAFVATYAEDARIHKPPADAPWLVGRAAIARQYGGSTFQRDGLRAEILARLVVGDKVVDHERTHGLRPEPLDFVVVYEVANDRIQAVWLHRAEEAPSERTDSRSALALAVSHSTGSPATNRFSLARIEHGSPDYDATVALRHEVLRAPLGLAFTAEQLAAERDDHHLVCRDGGALVGCLILSPRSSREVKMRQVAVAPSVQRRGVGRALVEFAEEYARSRGFAEMTLHARDVAVPFYEKLGYERVGDEFVEVSIPHWAMRKTL